MLLLQQLSSTPKHFRVFSSSQLHPKRQRQHMHFPHHSLMGATRYKIIVSPFPPKLGVCLSNRRFVYECMVGLPKQEDLPPSCQRYIPLEAFDKADPFFPYPIFEELAA